MNLKFMGVLDFFDLIIENIINKAPIMSNEGAFTVEAYSQKPDLTIKIDRPLKPGWEKRK
jgi:hypothetical protein